MLKKIIRATILIVIIIVICVGVTIAIKKVIPQNQENKINEKVFGLVQSKEAEITEIFTYGTTFNLSGRLTSISKDNFENAKLIITDGLDYEEIYKLSSEIVDGNLVFTTSEEINKGIILDKLGEKEYYLLLRVKLNNSVDPRYYTFVNTSEYSNIEYFTITQDNENRKVSIQFLEKAYDKKDYNYLSINIKNENIPNEVYDIVIDAGHGGKDTGEKSGSDTEADITLEYAKLLKNSLEEKGFKVKLTRDDDNTGSYTYTNTYDDNGRISIACETRAKYMVSFHINNGSSSLSGLEIYSPCKSNLDLAESMANNITQTTSINFSNNTSFKKSDGIYVKNFTSNVIKEYESTASKKGYEPYSITLDTPYLYTIREVGGIATNAYVDGRNKEYSANKYYNSNQGIECYQIELGYIKNDLEIIKNEKEGYVASIAKAIYEYIEQ